LRLAGSAEAGPINLGNPDEFTVLECARRVLQLTGSQSRIRFAPLPPDDPKQRRPDITRPRQLLGWQPKIALQEGLKLSLDYFRMAVRSASNS